MSFCIKLTGTLVNDVLCRGIGNACHTCTVANLIELGDTVARNTTYYLAFSQHQIDISQTEHREVGIDERVGISHLCAVGLQVGVLREGIATLEVAQIRNGLALTIGEELCTLVGDLELVNELRCYAQSTPTSTAEAIG